MSNLEVIPANLRRWSDHPFNAYWDYTLSHPDPTRIMMEPGVMQASVGCAFLDGWIGYLDIELAFLVHRYQDPQWGRWTLHSAYMDHCLGNAFHTELSKLGDDVVILARERGNHAPNGTRYWWYLWYDQDVSDCSIGRFESYDPPDKIKANFADCISKTGAQLARDAGFTGDVRPAQIPPRLLRSARW